MSFCVLGGQHALSQNNCFFDQTPVHLALCLLFLHSLGQKLTLQESVWLQLTAGEKHHATFNSVRVMPRGAP